jgi:hypothetical protein
MATQRLKERSSFMKTGYHTLLMAGGMIGVALPALAQPANLLAPLSRQSADGQSPGGEPADRQFQGGQRTTAQASTALYPDSPPLLTAARDDVENHRWNAAEGELERSETILLDGDLTSSSGVVTSPSPAMSFIIQARVAVKQHDQVDALLAIDRTMSTMFAQAGSSPPVGTAPASVAQVVSAAPVAGSAINPAPTMPAVPMITKALLQGHWQLTGSQHHWMPPDTSYRTVETESFIPGHYEYRGGAWVWVAGHYGKATN